jgi:hypothetical protein
MLGGANGVQLKSNAPFNWARAESFGLRQDPHTKFNVSSARGRSLSHKWSGKFLSTLQRPAMK